MRISLNIHSLQKGIKDREVTQLECLELAKTMGFDAVELLELDAPEEMAEEDYMDLIKTECERLDLEISNFIITAEILKTGEELRAEVTRIKHLIDQAAYLGVKRIQHHVTVGYGEESRYKGYNQAITTLTKISKIITAYGLGKGIATMVENSGYFFEDSQRIEQLVTAVANKNFGVVFNTGNFLYVDEEPIEALGRLRHYIKYIHVRDFMYKSGKEANPGKGFARTRGGNYLRETIAGHGDVPIYHILSYLQECGYTGYVGIAFEGMEPYFEAIQIANENIGRYLKYNQ